MSGNLRDQLQAKLSGTHTLERELGGGGMSKVFVADEIRLKRKVVVKVLSPELAQGISVERFEREIQTVAALQHANIVPVHTAGDTNGLPFYTMPYVEGESLRARLGRGALPVTEVIGILRDVTRALSYAHQRGVVHRDIKPDNVLLAGGAAVVTDFGIAKAISASRTGSGSATLTQVGTSIGTPAYMAPEQAAGDPAIDHRADIYALGAMAYELLAGQPVFANRTPQRMLAAHMGEAPKPITEFRADLPPALADLVMQCLAKEADGRPQQAAEIARVLETITSGSGMQAMPAALLGRQVSLGKALAGWAAAFAATFILAKAAVVGIGLPTWVLPGALILAALGLPAVLFTWYVQRASRRAVTSTPTLTPGGSPVPQGTLVTMAMQAAPHVSWRRTSRWGFIAGGVFVAVVAVFMLLRSLGIGPFGSLMAKGVLKRNDKVIVARFAATGSDTGIVGALTEALREDLSQSRAMSVMQPSDIRTALTQMQRPPESALTETLAREVAQRTGAKLVIAGDVTSLGAGFLISARVQDPATGDPLRSFRETAKDAGDVIAAIGRLSRTLRGSIGESLRSVHGAPNLEQVTTASLDAFRKYNEAIEISEQQGIGVMRARELLLEAVTLDSTFSMAYRKLAFLELDQQKQIEFAERAFHTRQRLMPIERSQAEGTYYWLVANDPDRAIAAYLEGFRIDSLNPRVLVNLAELYGFKREWVKSLEWADRAARVDTVQGPAFQLAAYVSLRRFSEAQAAIEKIRRVRPPGGVMWESLNFLVGQGQFDSAASASVGVLSANPTDLYMRAGAMWIRHVSNEGLGRLRVAAESWPATFASIRAIGLPLPPVTLVARPALVDVWLRERAPHAPALDSAIARARLDTIPLARQPYTELATVYAQAGRPAEATKWLRRYDAEVTDSLQRRRDKFWRHDAAGWIAMAEGRSADAVTEFRDQVASPCLCNGSTATANLAMSYDAAGQPDSARVNFERFVNSPELIASFAVPMWRPRILRRLGELYEAKGDVTKAADYYRQFIDLWKDADPELQPKVQAVREKLKKLTPVEKPR